MPNPVLGNRYEVQRQLGQKAGRRTLLARDLRSQALVVVKLLSYDSEVEWDEMKLFEREVETLKTLAHPAIPRYLDHFDVELRKAKGLALVETYINGKSLEDYIQAGVTFSESEVKQFARQLLEILIYLHGRQPPIVHRDIKPSNILLGDSPNSDVGQVYLINFGSVQQKAANRETSSFTVVGTYGYMPPEQFGGRTVTASDLYSLGTTLVTLLTGVHPSSLPQEGSQAKLREMSDLSPAFQQWLKQMTESMLDRRFTSASRALQALTQGNTVKLVPKPPGTKIHLVKSQDTLEITIPGLLGQIHLSINAQQICWKNQVLGLKLNRPQTARRQEISRLEYLQSHPNGKGQPKPQLVIWAGTQKYELGGDNLAIAESELKWLASELSNWLKLPLGEKVLSS